MSSVMHKVSAIVARQFQIPIDTLDAQTCLRDLGADSYDRVELQTALLEEFTLEISEEAAEKMLTIGDIVTFVERSEASQNR
jgi:acyl carrier protein